MNKEKGTFGEKHFFWSILTSSGLFNFFCSCPEVFLKHFRNTVLFHLQ